MAFTLAPAGQEFPGDYDPGAVIARVFAIDPTCTPDIYYRLNDGAPIVRVGTGAIGTLQAAQFVLDAVGTMKVEYWSIGSGDESPHRIEYVGVTSADPSIAIAVNAPEVTYPATVTVAATTSNISTTTAILEACRADKDPSQFWNWSSVATQTAPTKTYTFKYVPKIGYHYRVKSNSVLSRTAFVGVHALLTAPTLSSTQVSVGATLNAQGTIRPFHPVGTPAADTNYAVNLQKYNPATGAWATIYDTKWQIGSKVNDDESGWSYARSFAAVEQGLWRIRFYHQCPRHVATYSPAAEFAVGMMPTTLAISAPATVNYGAVATVSGVLKKATGAPLSGQPVKVQTSTNGITWTTYKTLTTSKMGTYSTATTALYSKRYLRTVFAGTAELSSQTSATKIVTPRVSVTNPIAPAGMTRGRSYSISGYIRPKHKAGTIPVQVKCYRKERQTNGTYKWVLRKVASTKVSNYSTYSKYRGSVSLASRGSWRLRAYAPADSAHAASWSTGYDYVTVR